MKTRSLISKFLAFVSMIIFAVIVNLTFTGYNFVNIFLSEDHVLKISKETILNPKILGDIFASALNDALKHGDKHQDSHFDEKFSDYVNTVDLNEFFKLAFPEEIITKISHDFISGVYEWLENEDNYPEICIQLEPVKNNFLFNLAGIVDSGISVLPECTSSQLEYFLELFVTEVLSDVDTHFYESMPKCKPHEPLLGNLKLILTSSAIKELNQIPDELYLASIINPENASSKTCMKCHNHGQYKTDPHLNILSKTKQYVSQIRLMLKYIWLIPAFFLFCTICFGAASLKGIARWMGWPFILSGILSLLIIFHLSVGSAFIQPDIICDSTGYICPAFVIVSSFIDALFKTINPLMHVLAISQLFTGVFLLFVSGKMK